MRKKTHLKENLKKEDKEIELCAQLYCYTRDCRSVTGLFWPIDLLHLHKRAEVLETDSMVLFYILGFTILLIWKQNQTVHGRFLNVKGQIMAIHERNLLR